MTKTYTPVNKKLIGLFILLGIFGCDGGQDSSSVPATLQKQQQQDTSGSLFANSLLAKQVDNVRGYINSLSDNKAYLVLGVNNEEKDLLERFNDSYIFLNIQQQNPTNPRSLTTDFNDLTQLQGLAAQLPGTFDKIILDDSTFKFTKWSTDHLVQFRNFLKLNGEFIFAPFLGSMVLRTAPDWKRVFREEVPQTEHAMKEHLLQQANLTTLKKMIFNEAFIVPFNFDSQADKLISQVFFEDVIPNNYVQLFGEVFGSGNVQVEYDKPLPFPSHYTNEPMNVLITATRKE